MNAIEKSRIIERTDIVAEIGARVELRRRGRPPAIHVCHPGLRQLKRIFQMLRL